MEQKKKTTIIKTYLFKSMNFGNDSYITLYKDYLLIERLKDNQEYCKGRNLEKKINYKDIIAVKIEKPSEADDGYIYFEEMNKEKDSFNQVFFYKLVSFERAKFIKESIEVYQGKKMKEEFIDKEEKITMDDKKNGGNVVVIIVIIFAILIGLGSCVGGGGGGDSYDFEADPMYDEVYDYYSNFKY